MRYLAAITLLILAIAMVQPVAAQSFKPDPGAGIAAWKQKDYATALRHFRPLADQSNAAAQFNLGWLHRKAAVFMTYSTEEIDAHTALAYGLVSKIAPLADLDGEVDKLIGALKKAPLPAVKAVKEFARNAFHNDIRTVNDFARNLHATVNASSRMQAG